MKLIDILARELKVWPDQYYQIYQDSGGHLIGTLSNGDLEDCDQDDLPFDPVTIAWDGNNAVIERADWQAAVDALNAPAVWDGKGLPPAGTVCTLSGPTERLHPIHPEWAGREVKIYAHFTSDNGHELAAYVGTDHMIGGVGVANLFVPIRTPEQIADDERAKAAIGMAVDIVGITSVREQEILNALALAGYRKQVAP